VVVILVFSALAMTFVQARNWSSLDRLISATARFSPESTAAQMILVNEVLIPAGRFAEAEEAAQRVRGSIPRHVLILYVRASREAQQGNWDRAREEGGGLEQFIDENQRPFLLMLVGSLAESRGDDVEALRRFYQAERGAKTGRDLENARQALSRIRSRHAARLEALRDRVAANPGDLAMEGRLANLELELFLLERAAARYRSILSRHPGFAAAHYNLGLTYARQARHAEAVSELKLAIEGGLVSATAWNNLAISYKQTGELKLAEDAFRRALQLDPGHCHAAINLGRLYLARDRTGPAREVFDRAARSGCNASYGDVIALNLEQIEALERR